MPPRKRAKRGVSTPAGEEDAMDIDAPTPDVEEHNEPPAPAYDILKDPWTDEQETALFKGIIKWKPNGMHKHFRMIALSQHLRNHGFDEKHTRIPGIWEKLKTMYNMEMIDEREDTFDDEEGEEENPPFIDFELPEEDYGLETFMRGKRSPSEAPSSPPRLAQSSSPPPTRRRKRGEASAAARTRASTVDDTDEARTSPPPAKTTRAGRSSTRSQARAKRDSTSRAPSKETTVDEDEGADETEETVEEDEEEEEEEAEEEKTSSPRPARGGSRAKADAAAKGAHPSRKSKRKK